MMPLLQGCRSSPLVATTLVMDPVTQGGFSRRILTQGWCEVVAGIVVADRHQVYRPVWMNSAVNVMQMADLIFFIFVVGNRGRA
jgi:hypothetical protein